MSSLEAVRAEIDAIDDAIIDLLASRQRLVEQAATFKADAAAVRGEDRRRRVMARIEQRAAGAGLATPVAAAVWTAMIDAFIALELEEHAQQRQRSRPSA